MRIVHEIDSEMQVGGGGMRLYCSVPGTTEFPGCFADIVIAGDDEVIHVEGDTRHMLKMFRDCINVIELQEAVMREDWERQQAKPEVDR